MPKVEPGVSCSASAGRAAAISTVPPATRNTTGRRMIARASRAHSPWSGSTGSPGRMRLRATPRRPYSESSAGCSVAAAAIDISGIRNPPTPIERMNGTGMNRSNASPIATVAPEKITARPAVAIVRTITSSFEPPRASSSRNRYTISSE